MSYYPPYVPVAKRRGNARKKMDKLRKKGQMITPIEPTGRKIVTTFWGKSWCDHIELFSDYENRLPRGRTYVRNGSVCHLAIRKEEVKAIVSGSELYEVRIIMSPLPKKKWEAIKVSCTGQIGSLLDLLNGTLSAGVMAVVSDPATGLFPQAKEIKLRCSCPDWADMCKHVAAVLYGVGARLDNNPQALFLLRGVNHEELIDISTQAIDQTLNQGIQQRVEDEASLSELFGIDFDTSAPEKPALSHAISPTTLPNEKKPTTKKKKHTVKKKSTSSSRCRQPAIPLPRYYSGIRLKKLRQALGYTQKEMAKQLTISAATLSKYENLGRKKVLFSNNNIEKKAHRLWRQTNSFQKNKK
ncbi:MAG: helix-turn-helix domain-containing protein [Gammaproteobacteria bacterium]|nr:helix-turn-helix domain-containing protein [Gammaproteobacteria bacterium]